MSLTEQYIEKYKAWLSYTPSSFRETVEHTEQTLCGVKIEVETRDYMHVDQLVHGQLSRVIFTKEDLTYACDCCDTPSDFYPVVLAGKQYICFRRTLYGFILLDCATLQTKYEYFPECVLNSEESFIVVTVKQIDDLLVFGGCYWACPDECFVFDYRAKRFLNATKLCGIQCLGAEEEVKDGKLILRGETKDGSEKEVSITKEALLTALEEQGTTDF